MYSYDIRYMFRLYIVFFNDNFWLHYQVYKYYQILTFSGGKEMNDIKNSIDALKKYDSLETVIAELEVFDADENAEITVLLS